MAMDEGEFRQEFHESGHVEWKQSVSTDKLQEAIVAFSNAEGGVIQIGVADNGDVVGSSLTPGVEVRLHDIVRGVRDPGRYSIHQLLVGQRSVIVLSVERRAEGFAQLPNGQILVRRGKHNVALFGQELVEFIGSRALTRFEATPLDLTVEDSDPALLRQLATAFGWTNEAEWTDRLVEGGLAQRGPGRVNLTVAGALCLREDASLHVGKAHIEVFRYAEPGSTEYDKRTEIGGPANHQVEAATRAVLDELGSDQVVLGTFRHELPRLPEIVVREAIANAVAHRSYELNGTPTRIEIFPDQVVIRSPGTFPEPVTEENIRDTTASRNPAIIKVLRTLRLAEDAGLGVDRMQDEMRAEMLDPPRFHETDVAVEVVLRLTGTVAPRERAWVREQERRGEIQALDRIVLVHAARGEVLTNARVRELLSVDSVEARQILQRLRAAQFLRQTGERGGSQYLLEEGLAPPAGLRLTRSELKEVIVAAAASGPVTNASVREYTGLGREEAKQLLRELIEEEALVLSGAGRGSHYVLPGTEREPQLSLGEEP